MYKEYWTWSTVQILAASGYLIIDNGFRQGVGLDFAVQIDFHRPYNTLWVRKNISVISVAVSNLQAAALLILHHWNIAVLPFLPRDAMHPRY